MFTLLGLVLNGVGESVMSQYFGNDIRSDALDATAVISRFEPVFWHTGDTETEAFRRAIRMFALRDGVWEPFRGE